jgi:microcystin-dependent protein
MADPYVGEIRIVPFNFAPTGWALCNGQLLSIESYTALFSLLGTYYGGNGTSNFALPNMQSRVPINWGQGAGLSDYVIGEVGGSEQVTLITNEIPSHTHALEATSANGATQSPKGNLPATTARRELYSSAAANTSLAEPSVGETGGNVPHENRQPYLVLNFIISLEGVFPSRS